MYFCFSDFQMIFFGLFLNETDWDQNNKPRVILWGWGPLWRMLVRILLLHYWYHFENNLNGTQFIFLKSVFRFCFLQKKNFFFSFGEKMIPHMKGLGFSLKWSKKKFKMADSKNSKWPPQKNLLFQLRQFSIFFHEIFMDWSLG